MVAESTSPWFAEVIPRLLDSQDQEPETVRTIVRRLTEPGFDETEGAIWLTALRMKGETGNEIAAAAEVLRERMRRLPTLAGPVLDTCGTGGDGTGTFNISTVVALVVAATGCPVVKHGNRAVSSRSGSADVLLALGVPIESGPEWATASLRKNGFAFCYAPHFHPALANVRSLRKKLGFRTIFNLLGPLLNPASAAYQLLGVGHQKLLDPLAEAVARLGIRQAFLVCGHDGFDEVSLSAPTAVRQVIGNRIEPLEWTPADFGLEPVTMQDLYADSPLDSARIIEEVLAGSIGPARRIVLANAAAGLLAAAQVDSLQDGVERAAVAIDSGQAKALLEALRQAS